MGSVTEADFGGLNPANNAIYTADAKKDNEVIEQTRPRLLDQLQEIERSSDRPSRKANEKDDKGTFGQQTEAQPDANEEVKAKSPESFAR